VFGFSFGELLVICVVALIAVGPKKLPGMLHTLGQWLRKLRNLTVEVRNQTGIDDLLRSEGLHGGLNELRGLLRGNHNVPFEAPVAQPAVHVPIEDPYANMDIDISREYPQEGADAYGALPDDLLEDEAPPTETKPEAAAKTETETKTEIVDAGPAESA
jgi:sec-independent protein translocase protein TatB